MSKNKKRNIRKKDPVSLLEPASKQPLRSATASNLKLSLFMLFAFLLIGLGYYFVVRRNAVPSVLEGTLKDYNVLLITVDTLRADHLPAYGYTKVKTPGLDQLAKESYVFEDVISTAPLTLPSHTSIMTGQFPVGHGVRDNGTFFVDPGEKTLAEMFQAKGYRTAAFVSAFVLDSRWQLNQGFDLYYDHFELTNHMEINPRDIQRNAGETESKVQQWLVENKNSKFFLWVHFYDPHDPYDPPEPYKSEYRSEPYDGEIAYTDENVGKLIAKLRQLGLMERTMIIATSDHGEGLGQHGEPNHGMFLYRTTQHVPLFIRIPEGRGTRVKGLVSHIDVAPTILKLTSIDVPGEMQGKSLIPMMNGMEQIRKVAYSESLYAELHFGWSPLDSITSSEYQFINAPKPELYDLTQDPGQTRNLILEKPSIAKTLKKELEEVIASDSRTGNKDPQKMDPETEEKLQALGYLGGSRVQSDERQNIDPKDKIDVITAIQQGFSAMMAKEYSLAVKIIVPVIQKDPEMTDGQFIAGMSYAGLGDYKKAIDYLSQTVALKPDHTIAIVNLAYAYQLAGDMSSAEFWYKKALDYDKNQMFAATKLAQVYQITNQPDKSHQYLLKAVQFYEEGLKKSNSPEEQAYLLSTLGEIYFSAGDLRRARESLEKALQLTGGQKLLNYNLAQVYEAAGNLEGAISAYERETRIDPVNFRAFNNLGILYERSNRMDEAVQCFQRVIALNPQDPRGYLMLASVFKKMGKDQESYSLVKEAQIRQQKITQ